ncbi:Radical SAM domain protein [Chitinispirillum alkaliphilum]|nr:Radical SAM domain protein [Chitinispirillum alkaliphilum]
MRKSETDFTYLRSIESTLQDLMFPTRFAVEVTAECNLKCSMCHHPGMKRPKGRMPFELWKRCADQIAAVSPQTQCWFSFCGEPLLEPQQLIKMIQYGKRAGLLSLNINTNGMLLTPEWAEPVADSGVDLVVFGIDAFSAETLEKIRVEARRDVVYGNVEKFLKTVQARNNKPEVQVQFIEMEENAHELSTFKEYWLSRGATAKVRRMLSWGGAFDVPVDIPQEHRIACPWACTMMHVFWDGRVPRCPGDIEGEESAGNAWDEPLEQLWGKLGVYRRMHMEKKFDDLPQRCKECTDWMTGSAERIQPDIKDSAISV